jgi:CD68 antigen
MISGKKTEDRRQERLTTDHRPQTTDHRPQTTDHRPQTTDHRQKMVIPAV